MLADAIIFVYSAAIDYLCAEWNNKPVGVVCRGVVGDTRAAEHHRPIAGELQRADVRTSVAWSLLAELQDVRGFEPLSLKIRRSTP